MALVCGVLLWVCHFPIGILGQVWYLIVSIPDLCTLTYFEHGHPEGGGGQEVQTPLVNSQVAIDFLRNGGTDPLKKQFDPLCPIASRGRFVRPSVKYVDD